MYGKITSFGVTVDHLPAPQIQWYYHTSPDLGDFVIICMIYSILWPVFIIYRLVFSEWKSIRPVKINHRQGPLIITSQSVRTLLGMFIGTAQLVVMLLRTSIIRDVTMNEQCHCYVYISWHHNASRRCYEPLLLLICITMLIYVALLFVVSNKNIE